MIASAHVIVEHAAPFHVKGPNLLGDGPPVAPLPSSIHASFHKPGLVKHKVYEKPAYLWA
jgi:hypothetical protein